MRSVAVIPSAAAERVAPLLQSAGWQPASSHLEVDDASSALRAVGRGDPVIYVPDRAKPSPTVQRIVVVHEGGRGDRAGMDAADEVALASGAEIVVIHVPATTPNPPPGSLAYRIADHGAYDLEEWRNEFLRRFCRCSPGVRVSLRVGATAPPSLIEQVRSESPDLLVVSGAGDEERVRTLVESDIPVLLVPAVGRDRAAYAGAERGQHAASASDESLGETHRVRDVMATTVVSVDASTPLEEVARVLAKRRISGVPVLSRGGTLEGVVTEADLFATVPPTGRPGGPGGPSTTSAREAMTTPPVTIGPDQPIADAVRLMRDRGVNRLPVVDGGKVIGIVTRTDLLAAWLSEDARSRPGKRAERG